MFAKIRTRVTNLIGPEMPSLPEPQQTQLPPPYSQRNRLLPDKIAYARPPFLQLLTNDELKASADHNVRPIIVPRDITVLPWNTGYAEVVNSGKSEWNEDQAAFCRRTLSHPSKLHPDLPYTYFGIFDGHAGYGAALAASLQFHHFLHEKLVDCIDMLIPIVNVAAQQSKQSEFPTPISIIHHRPVTKDELIIGALESAFMDMDALLANIDDRNKYRNAGGCTALVALFIFGKMFVANAGDSRAVLCQRISNEVLKTHTSQTALDQKLVDKNEDSDTNKKHMHIFPIPFSHDHTPDTERPRIMSTAKLNPILMGGEYVAMEYAKRPVIKDLGQRILYRQGTMKGWAYKTLTSDDLKIPIVTGEGKRSRLMGTIGVTRGFGDHDLRAIGSGLLIKPFLSAHPEVIYRDLTKVISIPEENNHDGDYGILVMATDGLWDVADTESVSTTVFTTLQKYPTEKHRYTMVAQELVAKSRGRINESGHWRLADSKAAATVDDISVICVPVYQYYKEYIEWEKMCQEEAEKNLKALMDSIGDGIETHTNGSTNGKEEDDVEMNAVDETTESQKVSECEPAIETTEITANLNNDNNMEIVDNNLTNNGNHSS